MEKILELKNVYKEFDEGFVLEDVSFSVFKNDIFGFLGPNGAGKTTTIRLILDLLSASKGDIIINNIKSTENNVRRNIGFCLDDNGLYDTMTAYENLEFFDKIYNSKAGRDKRINSLLEEVNLEVSKNKKVSGFSKGMKKRLGIARAIINNPSLLVLDEPMSGLDPDGQRLLKNILKELSKKTTIFFSSHDLDDVENICNRVAILNKHLLVCDEIENLKNGYEKILIVQVKNDKAEILKSKNLIRNLKGITDLKIDENVFHIKYNQYIEFKDIISCINNTNLEILDIKHEKISLEDIYFNIVEGDKENA